MTPEEALRHPFLMADWAATRVRTIDVALGYVSDSGVGNGSVRSSTSHKTDELGRVRGAPKLQATSSKASSGQAQSARTTTVG